MTEKLKQNAGAVQIGINCFVAYATCYVGKNMLSALMPQLIAESGFSDAQLGSMGSVFMLTYGFGQLINGIIGTRVHARYMVSAGLMIPGILLFLFAVIRNPAAAMILWGVGGFCSAMLWGPISETIGANTKPAFGQILLTMMTVASTIGTLVTYALAVLGSAISSWRASFWVAGAMMCLAAVFWFFFCLYQEKKGTVKHNHKNADKASAHTHRFRRLFLTPCFICMVVVTMLNGVIRNAVAFWTPTFLTQYLMLSPSASAMITMLLPFVNIAGIFVSLFLLRLAGYNEKRMCMVLFVFSAVMYGVMIVCAQSAAAISIVALFTASAAMMGASNMVFSTYILRFASTGLISGITGFLDFSSYMSASAASLVLTGQLAAWGWQGVIASWIVVVLLGAVFSLIADRTDKAARSESGADPQAE